MHVGADVCALGGSGANERVGLRVEHRGERVKNESRVVYGEFSSK